MRTARAARPPSARGSQLESTPPSFDECLTGSVSCSTPAEEAAAGGGRFGSMPESAAGSLSPAPEAVAADPEAALPFAAPPPASEDPLPGDGLARGVGMAVLRGVGVFVTPSAVGVRSAVTSGVVDGSVGVTCRTGRPVGSAVASAGGRSGTGVPTGAGLAASGGATRSCARTRRGQTPRTAIARRIRQSERMGVLLSRDAPGGGGLPPPLAALPGPLRVDPNQREQEPCHSKGPPGDAHGPG